MRTFEATLLNEIANDPRVRPNLLAPEGPIDLTGQIGNPANVTIVNRSGGFIAIQMTPMLYECHTIFTPEKESFADVLTLAHEAQTYMFTHTQATELITRVADGNRGADIAARKARFKEIGRQKNLAPGVDAAILRVGIDDWALSSTESKVEGWSFHNLIAEAKAAAGKADSVHEDDDRHDKFVGAALLMAKSGQTMKAFMFYNRAAFIYGYEPIRMVNDSPAILDTGDAVITIVKGDVEVMLVKERVPRPSERV